MGSIDGIVGRVGERLFRNNPVKVIYNGVRKDFYLNLQEDGELFIVTEDEFKVGGGLLLGVLVLLLNGEFAGLGRDVISTRNSPCT